MNEGNREGEGQLHHMGPNNIYHHRLGHRHFFYVCFFFFSLSTNFGVHYYSFYFCYNNMTIHDPAIYHHRCEPLLAGWMGGR
jgi:hypothetical protein